MPDSSADGSPGPAARAVSRRRLLLGTATGGLVAAAGLAQARSEGPGEHAQHPATPATREGEPQLREFTLTAEEFDHQLMPGVTTRAWGYNGQTPGPELRV